MFLFFLFLKIVLAGFCENCGRDASMACSACHQGTYCSKSCLTKCWAEHRPFCHGVEIKQSALPHAGLGLFVRRNYAPGETIALFTGRSLPCGYFDRYDPYFFIYTAGSVIRHVIGDPKQTDPYLAAQMVNDGGITKEHLRFFDMSGKIDEPFRQAAEDFAYSYMVGAGDENNATMDSSCALKATLPIRPGEEVCMSYGIDYWMQHMLHLRERRGLVGEVRAICQAASAGVLRFVAAVGQRNDPRECFVYYVSPRDLPPVTLLERVASLVMPSHVMALHVANPARLQQVADEMGIEEVLAAIETAPSHEFYDKKGRVKPHHLSPWIYAQLSFALGDDIMIKIQDHAIDVRFFMSSLEGDGYNFCDELDKCKGFRSGDPRFQ